MATYYEYKNVQNRLSLVTSDKTQKTNSDYEKWIAQDQALLAWLRNLMAIDIAT